jgi:YVTN family beta-propeller protein
MRLSLRICCLLAALLALSVVRIHGGEQYLPPPPPLPPDYFPMDPPDPYTDPFNPNDLPGPAVLDFPPEWPDPPDDDELPIPEPPHIEDPFPDLPSLFPGDELDDIPPPPIIPFPSHSVGKAQALAVATNPVVPLMPFPRRILFRPTLGSFPHSTPPVKLSCDPANQTRLIIPESKGNSVYFMDTCPVGFSSRVSVGTKPVFVKNTPDGRALVANVLDGTISVINLATRMVTGTISLPRVNNTMMQPNCIAVAPDGSRAYVSSHVDLPESFVFILDLNTMTFAGTSIPVGAFPAGMAITPDGSQLWVSSRGDSRVDVFDTATNEKLTSYNVLLSTGVAINPTGTRAYLAEGTAPGSIIVVDTSTFSIVANIPVGDLPHSLAVTSTGRHVFVTNALSNSITQIDAASNTVVQTIKLKGQHPLGLAFVANGTFLK